MSFAETRGQDQDNGREQWRQEHAAGALWSLRAPTFAWAALSRQLSPWERNADF